MKRLKLYTEFINEKLNILKGPSNEETLEEFDKLPPNEALSKSLNYRFIPGIKRALDRGADVNAKTVDGWTPLIIASYIGNLNIVKCLVENGADVNAKIKTGWTAYDLAETPEIEAYLEEVLKQRNSE